MFLNTQYQYPTFTNSRQDIYFIFSQSRINLIYINSSIVQIIMFVHKCSHHLQIHLFVMIKAFERNLPESISYPGIFTAKFQTTALINLISRIFIISLMNYSLLTFFSFHPRLNHKLLTTAK